MKGTGMSKKKRAWVAGACGLAAAGLLLTSGCDRESDGAAIDVARPAKIFTVRTSGEGAPHRRSHQGETKPDHRGTSTPASRTTKRQ